VNYIDFYNAWENDEFVLDPCRLTLFTGKAGIDGDTFKNKYLMDQYEIQVNKTSINSVLFMTTIGTTRSAIAYLLEALLKITNSLERIQEEFSQIEATLHQRKVKKLTESLPPLPNFSYFYSVFQSEFPKSSVKIIGDLRKAFFLAYDEEKTEYIQLNDECWTQGTREIVNANFIIPYPPGFPILVPGQVVTPDVIAFFKALDVKEVHGFHADYGLRVFKQEVLDTLAKEST